jgi:hypothetical protein
LRGLRFTNLQLGFGRVLAEGAHDGAQLLSGDGAIAILVKQGEGLLKLGNLLFGQLVRHGNGGVGVGAGVVREKSKATRNRQANAARSGAEKPKG